MIDELRGRRRTELLAFSQSEEERELVGPSGQSYYVEIQSFWDHKPEQNLRVMACIDDGGFQAFKPLCGDFIVAPDGLLRGRMMVRTPGTPEDEPKGPPAGCPAAQPPLSR